MMKLPLVQKDAIRFASGIAIPETGFGPGY
jgi:hypothetical protein